MADTPARPDPDARRTLLQRTESTCRLLTMILYVGTALLGTLVTSPVTLVVVVPLVAVVSASAVSLIQHFFSGRRPTAQVALRAAALGAAFVPFGEGLPLLGGAGAFVLLVILGMLPVTASSLRRPTGDARPAAAGSMSTSRGGEASLREVLGVLSLEALIGEWHDATSGMALMSSGPRYAASVTLHGFVLADLRRRDPAGVQRWIEAGAIGSPAAHVRDDLPA